METFSSVPCLLKIIVGLRGLESHVEEAQDASDDVDDGVRDPNGAGNVAHMTVGIVKREGLREQGGNVLGELYRGVKGISPWESIELRKSQI